MAVPIGFQKEKPESSKGNRLVLVVEDSRMIAAMLKQLLESEGFDVLVAVDGLSGLKAARGRSPRLVVTDFEMPEMNGLEMVKALRTDPRTHNIPIVMLSANDKADDRARALAAGADDYAIKGDVRQLVCQIKSLLTRSR